ncbi:hypothetical protein NC651_037331 [Populus alba x Populus x berolinensis]|nr:hypothetical protein NC651_037331 [Populus alba x Populus x berolinensis]
MATLTPICNETQLLIQSICASVIKGSWNNLLRPKFGSNDYHLITTTATVRQTHKYIVVYRYWSPHAFDQKGSSLFRAHIDHAGSISDAAP